MALQKAKSCLIYNIMAECDSTYAERTIGVQVILVFCPAWIVTLKTLHAKYEQSRSEAKKSYHEGNSKGKT